MSLRRQIILAFTSAVVLPILIVGLLLAVTLRHQVTVIENTYGLGWREFFSGVSVETLASLSQSAEEKITNIIHLQPDRLGQTAFLGQLNQELSQNSSSLLVRKGQTILYDGTDGQLDTSRLPAYGSDPDRFMLRPEDRRILNQLDFTFTDGSEGTVFILTSLQSMLPEMRSTVVVVISSLILLLIFMITGISAWAYGAIIRPVGMLRSSAKRIRDGDLDFKIDVPEDKADEIGRLCIDFDEMRQRLKESAEEKLLIDTQHQELIRNISHDLKTPITSIKGYSEAILEGVADSPEKMNRYVTTIHNKAEDMQRLIDELSYYSKIDTHDIPYNYTILSVRDYFDDCADELSADLDAEGIHFGYENTVIPSVRTIADPEQLKKVINNIISNSVKYMDKPEPAIAMSVTDREGFVHVAITDNGRGIARKDLGLIFDRFYRTDEARTSPAKGSGIGLSIVKKIIEDHGGRIWAESVEGAGTTIRFELREYTEPAAQPEEQPAAKPRRGFSKRRRNTQTEKNEETS